MEVPYFSAGLNILFAPTELYSKVVFLQLTEFDLKGPTLDIIFVVPAAALRAIQNTRVFKVALSNLLQGFELGRLQFKLAMTIPR